MTIAIARRVKHASLALIALSSAGGLQTAFAVGTDAGTSISGRATVNYSVGGVAQTQINSSPTGNSTAGPAGGADTSFVVDRRVFMSVADVPPSPTELSTTVPGGTAVIRRFTLVNTSNRAIGFRFVSTDLGTGQFVATNLAVRVDSATQPNASYAPGVYDPGVDTATTAVSVPEDHSVTVYVLGDIPASAVNGDVANVELQAIAIEPSAPANVGAVGSDLVATIGADTAGIDTVFGDAGNDGREADSTTYLVASAALSVAKTVTVISDPISTPLGQPAKAIPLAIVEYAIAITNTGATTATLTNVTDPIPANATFSDGSYNAGASNVQINVGGGPATFCQAELGSDANADGCSRTATTLTVAAPAVSTVATGAGNAVTVRFRVQIN